MKKQNDTPLLRIENLRKTFPGEAEDALCELSARIDRGMFLGVVGPDGAGKTTLLRMVAGLLSPDHGTVRILGYDPIKEGARVREQIGYMPQRFGLYEDLSVAENLRLNADLRGVTGEQRKDTFAQLLDFTSLQPFQKRRASALSGGMKQKLGLACALLARPRLLLLDEPSVGVDPISRRELRKMVQELVREGMGVLWSTAYLDEAEVCDEVLLLNEGNVVFNGHPEELTRQAKARTFRIGNLPSRRETLSKLLDTRNHVSDGVIEGSQLRLVLKDGSERDDIAPILPEVAEIHPVQPRFEDAFIDLLGGGPGGTSALARQTKKRETNPENSMVEARNLSKRFGDFYATREVNFQIRPGEIFGLLGPNGAGKSTTFKMMCGLLNVSEGEALVGGMNLQKAGGQARQQLGYMAQKFSLYGNLNVRQNLEFFAGTYGLRGKHRKKRIDLMIEIFGLAKMLRVDAGTLPLGYKQRLALACAMMHDPDLLFLDEPTSGVDPVTRREFWNHIYGLTGKGITVMVTTHFMDEAEYCDRIGMVYRGELIALGTPDELKEQVAGPDTEEPTMEETFITLIQRQEKGERRSA